jgi:Fur family transcriptional regulator, ferric uptake regulator
MSDDSCHSAGDFIARATDFWQQRGGRLTFVRKLICDCAARRRTTFTAESLWTETRKTDKGISIASIYRTLADLAEAGLLREFPRPGHPCMFVRIADGGQAKGHLICKDCKRVVPFDDDCLALREGTTVRTLGFQTAGMSLRIEAHCENLRQSGNCEHSRNKNGEKPTY